MSDLIAELRLLARAADEIELATSAFRERITEVRAELAAANAEIERLRGLIEAEHQFHHWPGHPGTTGPGDPLDPEGEYFTCSASSCEWNWARNEYGLMRPVATFATAEDAKAAHAAHVTAILEGRTS